MKSVVEAKHRPLINEADADLLVYMEMAKDDQEYAEKAFREFYERYKKYLMLVVTRVCSRLPNKDEAVSIVFNNTFYNVYRSSHTFKFDKNKGEIELQIKAWIGKIAKNEFLRLFCDRETEEELTEEVVLGAKMFIQPDTYEEEEEDQAKPSFEKELLAKALDTLSERDRLVLLTYIENEQDGNYIPRNILDNLAEMCQTTKTNLRKIKERSLKKVLEFIKANS